MGKANLDGFHTSRSVGGGIGVTAEEESIQGELAGTKDEDKEGGEKNSVRGGSGELVGVGKDGEKSRTVAEHVSVDHVNGQDESRETRQQADDQKNAADKFNGGNKGGGGTGSRDTERGKVVCDAREIVEFSPAVLRELHTPVDADKEQEGRLKRAGGPDRPGVEFAN